MEDVNTAAALRLASCHHRAVAIVSGEAEGLTLAEAARACGMRSPVSDADLVDLAHACELAGLVTNLDDEAGSEWVRVRSQARAALDRMTDTLAELRALVYARGRVARGALDEFESESGPENERSTGH